MENFAVSRVVANKRKRSSGHPPEIVQKVVNVSRHIGCTAAAAKINKDLSADEQVTVSCAENWLKRYKKDGEFWKDNYGKRGRPAVLNSVPGAREEWLRQVESLQRQGEPVSGRAAAAVVKAVLEEKAPSVLVTHGGNIKGCAKTGQRLLAAEDLTYRKKTSSRIIPPEATLVEARDDFYKDLRSCFPEDVLDPSLLINFDQTHHLYNPSRGFTWAKRGATRVQVTDSKEGFTLVPVVSATGIIGAQLIFPGSTATALPSVDPGAVLHYTQTATHWSNEQTTLRLMKDIIFPHVAARRAELDNDAAPAIILADSFKPHWTAAVRALVAEQDFVAYVAIPDALTHIFQPLDLGVIAAIKQSVARRKDEYLQTEVQAAIREGRDVSLSRSRPVLRNKVTSWIKDCITDPLVCGHIAVRLDFNAPECCAFCWGTIDVFQMSMRMRRHRCVPSAVNWQRPETTSQPVNASPMVNCVCCATAASITIAACVFNCKF